MGPIAFIKSTSVLLVSPRAELKNNRFMGIGALLNRAMFRPGPLKGLTFPGEKTTSDPHDPKNRSQGPFGNPKLLFTNISFL